MSHVRLNVFCGLYSCVKVWNVKGSLSILEFMSVGPVTFAPHHESIDGMEVSVSDDHYLYTNDTESDEESDGNEYMEYIKRNAPRGKKHSRYPGSLTQPLDVSSRPWKYWTDSGVASLTEADRKQSLEDKAFNILVAWRNGMGNKPTSWDTILEALKTSDLGDLASEIQTDIEARSLYGSNSHIKDCVSDFP